MKNYWKPNRIKTFDMHLNIDTDRDGKIDRFDCRPFDWKRQDEISQEEKERQELELMKSYKQKAEQLKRQLKGKDKLTQVREVQKQSAQFAKDIIKIYPESKADIETWVYETDNPNISKFDPLVQIVTQELYKKGFQTSQSCQGRVTGEKEHGPNAQLSVTDDNRLVAVLRGLGFQPSFYGAGPSGFISMEYPKQFSNKQEREIFWRRVYEEVRKL